jgi:spermidine synthase
MFQRGVAVASACFVLSGAAALVYQVAWQRLLALTTGVAVPSVAAITAAFMAGLGLGSHLGGLWSERLSPRRAVRAFAMVELGIAAFASVSVWIYYHGLYQRMPWLYGHGTVATFTVHFASLMLPTVLMGMSLPLLVRGLVLSVAEAPRTIGFLYAANALGAAAGAFATPWLLLRFFGVDGAVLCGAGLSATAGLGALLLSRRPEPPGAEAPEPGPVAAAGLERALSLNAWVALYALSGFVALSLEIVWFRVLDVMTKGGAFTFGTLLGMYLVGLAAGSWAATATATRVRRPLLVFLTCQGLLLLFTLLGHALLVRFPYAGTALEWMVRYGASTEFLDMDSITAGEFVYLYVGMPLALFGPATFCMGFGFPVLQRAVQRDPVSAGRKVGLLQAANIAGCTLGSLATGLLLLDVLGTAGVFRLLGLLGLAVVLWGAWHLRARSLWALAAALAAVLAWFPNNKTLWLRLHGAPAARNSFFEEDAASITAFTPRPGSGYTMRINGRPMSWIPFGSFHTVLGAVPALVHPAPRHVAVIGLGSGDTAWALGLRKETEQITVFEIATSQPRLLERMRHRPGMHQLDRFLGDPRVRLVKDDGRRRIGTDGVKYDVIEADALYPDSGLAGYLYSVEFFQLAARALKPGGILCTWVPRARVEASAQRAFRHALKLDKLLVLSNDPLSLEPEVWRARLSSPEVQRYLGSEGGEPTRSIESALATAAEAEPLNPDHEFNEDLQPRDEFARPRRRIR